MNQCFRICFCNYSCCGSNSNKLISVTVSSPFNWKWLVVLLLCILTPQVPCVPEAHTDKVLVHAITSLQHYFVHKIYYYLALSLYVSRIASFLIMDYIHHHIQMHGIFWGKGGWGKAFAIWGKQLIVPSSNRMQNPIIVVNSAIMGALWWQCRAVWLK